MTYLLILKSYMAGIPEALYESARLDGAGDFTIYLRVAMPLCKAGLATVGLFIALNYWNDWYDAMLFLDEGRSDLYPLAVLPEQHPHQGPGHRARRPPAAACP